MKYVKKIVIPLMLVVLLGGFLYWLFHWRYIETTDNAYTQSDITNISARISSQVMVSCITDNHEVKQGQLLAILDDRAYKVAILKAEADVAKSLAALSNAQANAKMQESIISQYSSSLLSAQASEKYAGQELSRFSQLNSRHYIAQGDMDKADSTHKVAVAGVAEAQASLQTQQAKLAVLKTTIEQDQAQLKQAQASLADAQLQLTYTRIVAPVSGVIGNRNLRVGMFTQAGQTVASIVPEQHPWVVANFKETQRGGMKPGQAVDIAIDSYPGKIFKGHIESLAPATGSVFALLPADNATGNFTKIVQRLPVKIVFNQPIAMASGLSCEVTVDTRHESDATQQG
ncbi:HlyD family secretion protein [Atlantibacter sp.]|uniref:HlyD family secretion protein n=1 Tax=Atlantibacter sp. TaxID=1903473 RepID=UPI0028AD5C9E|nr:HlyD family secretion protein [Atlantibacter sp.]